MSHTTPNFQCTNTHTHTHFLFFLSLCLSLSLSLSLSLYLPLSFSLSLSLFLSQDTDVFRNNGLRGEGRWRERQSHLRLIKINSLPYIQHCRPCVCGCDVICAV